MSVMRMVDLLTHMSGLTYGIQNRTNVDAAYRKARLDGHACRRRSLRHRTRQAPARFDRPQAGTIRSAPMCWRHDGAAFGDEPGEFLQSRIFAPLGMVDTGFHCPPKKGNRLTDSWYYAPGEAPKLLDLAQKVGSFARAAF